MSEPWQHQLRIYLSDEMAAAVRSDGNAPVLKLLMEILNKHHATLVSQLDAFESYLAEAEQTGAEDHPLYKWTKATVDDPSKRAKHAKAFALYVSGNIVYGKEAADALEADLRPFVGGEVITRMTKHDTNPATNMRVPSEYQA